MSYRTRERFASLHLTVHRFESGSLGWTLVLRQANGARSWDRRLGWGQLEYSPGSPESTGVIAALQAALKAASRARADAGSAGADSPDSFEGLPGDYQV